MHRDSSHNVGGVILDNKSFKFEIKSIDEKTGEFEGYASVFGVSDSYNDIVEKGAFAKTIMEQKGKVPILDSHYTDEEIGMTTELKEDEHGLYFKGKLYIDDENPKNEVPAARTAYAKMKHRKEMDKPLGVSIGYDTVKKEDDEYNNERVRRLKEIKLWEISLVTFPANTYANVLDVKQTELTEKLQEAIKEGRVLSKNNIGLIKEAIDSLNALLEAGEPSDDTQKQKGAADIDDEPGNHSLDSLVKEINGLSEFAKQKQRKKQLEEFAKQLKSERND